MVLSKTKIKVAGFRLASRVHFTSRTSKVAGLRPRSAPYSFVRHKRVSRKSRPNSLPCGFPLFRYPLQLRKKLATLRHFSSKPCKAPLHAGCVTRGRTTGHFFRPSNQLRYVGNPPEAGKEVGRNRIPGTRNKYMSGILPRAYRFLITSHNSPKTSPSPFNQRIFTPRFSIRRKNVSCRLAN